MNAITDIKRIEGGYALDGLAIYGQPPRASQAALLIAKGHTAPQCGQVMGIKKDSVKALKQNLFFKFKAHSTPDFITKAFGSGALRFLSLLAALHIAIAAPGDHQFSRARVRISARPARTQNRDC